MNELSTEVMGKIKSFSGEMTAGERIIEQGMTVQKVQTPYTTAVTVQKPRTIARVTANVLEEATLAGASFFYRWKVKNKKTGREDTVEGPSIDLAMCVARNYGNCAIDIQDEETLQDYKFKGVFIDLESGFTCPRLFKQRKNQGIGMDDAGRASDIVYQIGQSKAIRNAIVRAMPTWLMDQAIETATKAEISRIKPENIVLSRSRVFYLLQQYGATQDRVEEKLGRKMDDWTPQDVVDLKGSVTALKEGRVSVAELFPEIEEKAKETKTKAKKEVKTAETKPEKTADLPLVPGNAEPEMAPGECPNAPGDIMTKEFCEKCLGRKGCPVWE